MDNLNVMKKDGTLEKFNFDKILKAVGKSADRACKEINKIDFMHKFKEYFIPPTNGTITVQDLHKIVENIATKYDADIGKSYKDYRNYKEEQSNLFIDINRQADKIMYDEDKSNANSDNALISTKKSGIAGNFLKEKYQHFNLNIDERQAIKDGFIYIHDLSDRGLNSLNCTLFDSGNIMKGGFEMSNMPYDEPSYISSACAVLGDIIMGSSAQMYGGHTTHEIDKLLAPYCKKSYRKLLKEEIRKFKRYTGSYPTNRQIMMIKDEVNKSTIKELQKGIKGLEVKLNSVVSARGSFPFTTFTFGAGESRWAKEVTLAILHTRMNGHGKFNKIAIFPKLIFLYDEELHGTKKDNEFLFDKSIECSQHCMYPDYMSYKRYKVNGVWKGAMGCRAFVNDDVIDENGNQVYVGRANIGAISLNLPLIYQEAKIKGLDFFKELEIYLQMIRKIHKQTYESIGNMKASSNPLGFMEGGFYGGNLKADDKVADVLKTFTASFGITALHELTILHGNKSIADDNSFAIETLEFINNKVEGYKKEDNYQYALYGTPAESYQGLQCEQFKKRFGIIKGVSDKDYFNNSFHCAVTEKITPFEKQDKESVFFDLVKGGQISYARHENPDNFISVKNTVKRAMDLGLYHGVNFPKGQCDDCGHHFVGRDNCPKCGSTNLTVIDRVTGYLGNYKVKGNTAFNSALIANVDDRESM